jgi:NAD+ diphosphatase
LGLDESPAEDGLSYKVYKGSPCFALDVTPKEPKEQEAKGIIAAMEAQGLAFHQARVITSVPAGEGWLAFENHPHP